MNLFESDKLDQVTQAMLREGGWVPGRYVDMSAKAEEFEAWGLPMHGLARSILEQLHGVSVEPVGHEGENFAVDTIKFDPDAAAEMDVARELESQFGEPFFPVALMYVDGIYVAPSGLTVCSLQDENWVVARGFEEALDRLICLTGEVERFDRP